MKPIDRIKSYHAELTAQRQDFHAHPELGFDEHRTSDIVARQLEALGIEVHRGVGNTGVVGVLREGNGPVSIGLRADMDALPILEANDMAYKSTKPGVMHASAFPVTRCSACTISPASRSASSRSGPAP